MKRAATYTQQSRELREAWREEFKPPMRQTCWKWAEENIILSERCGTGHPGPFRSSITPYIRGVLDTFHTAPRIVLCFASQTAKTTALFCMLAYCICEDPGPALFVLPTDALARRLSKKRLQTLINDSPRVRREKTGVDDDFQLLSYTLRRMSVNLVGSNSPSGVSSDPIRYLFLDETDKFSGETTTEADALSLAIERTKAFWNSRIVITSTPTTPEGNIWHAFQLTDQRYFNVPCLHCGTFQKLVFENLRWPELKSIKVRDLDENGWYECIQCNQAILDKHKPEMLREGRWKPEQPGEKWAGFHLNSLYAPWLATRFGSIAAEYVRSRRFTERLRNFRNAWLALPYDPEEEGHDSVSEERVVELKGEYRKNTCPVHSTLLTMGCDVQETLMFFVVRAWIKREGIVESFLVNWGIAHNFKELREIFAVKYPAPGRKELYRAHIAAIDSGYRTPEVYDFCRKIRGFVPIKGRKTVRAGETGVIPHKRLPVDPKQQKGGLFYFLVNTSYYKQWLYYDQINNMEPDASETWHLPIDVDGEYVKQLMSEKEVVITDRYGRRKREWRLKKGHPDNHLLDCEIYAAAIADVYGVRYLTESTNTASSQGEAQSKTNTATKSSQGGWAINPKKPMSGWLKR